MNIGQILRNEKPTHQGSWNAVCLADFGDGGIAFVAQPQIPPPQCQLVFRRQMGAHGENWF